MDVSTLVIGQTLGRNIYDSNGQLLLLKGTVMEEHHIQKLKLSYNEIFILAEQANICNENNYEEDKNTNLAVVFDEVTYIFRDLMYKISQGHSVKKNEVEESVKLLYPEVMNTNNILKHLRNLRNKDEYTLQHSVSVSTIAMKLGQAMKISQEAVKNLAVAGLLHDIGKCQVPLEILNKPGPLNPDEFKEIQKHPLYGYKIVNELGYNDRGIVTAVLQHHEHQDGKGYPFRIIGKNIHEYSSIIAVADVFDALTSDRVYRPRISIFQAVNEIIKNTFGHLEPMVSKRLVTYILDIAPGENVILNTGEQGTIVLIDDVEPTRPMVRVKDRFINLKSERDIYINDIL